MGGGLFIVPAFAAVQSWAPAERRARMVAGVNVLNALYMTIGGASLAILQAMSVPLWLLYVIVASIAFGAAFLVSRHWVQAGDAPQSAVPYDAPAA